MPHIIMRPRSLLCAILSILGIFSLHSETRYLVIQPKVAEVITIDLTTHPIITFDGNKLQIQIQSKVNDYALEDILYFGYTKDGLSSSKEILIDYRNLLQLENGCLIVSSEFSDFIISDINGRIICDSKKISKKGDKYFVDLNNFKSTMLIISNVSFSLKFLVQ